ncbi:ATP-dependent helicase, partial [Patescibacteria group bacterium]|nr:ATP-dependent helicase [Patescibacteria group bacterium]
MSFLHSLNSRQKIALKETRRSVLIVAGPGTGKTKTLVGKIIYLLNFKKIPAQSILALTFTQKASREIKQRIKNDLPPGQPVPFIGTFHGLSLKILKHQAQSQKLTPKIIDEKTRRSLINELIYQNKTPAAAAKQISFRELSLFISKTKSSLKPAPANILAPLVKHYNQILKEQNLRDFDDLLQNLYQLLKNNPSFQKNIQQQYKFILIDEFQDTSPLQYQLIKAIAHPRFCRLFAIGDPLQSIYGFRLAHSRTFSDFLKDFPHSRKIIFKINYRNAPCIISASHDLFPQSPRLIPASKDDPAGRVCLVATLNQYTEADWIIKEISRQLGGLDLNQASRENSRRQKPINFSDFAVIFRLHHLGRTLKNKFKNSGIPYQTVGGDTFFEKPIIQFIISWLFYLDSPKKELIYQIKKMPFSKIPAACFYQKKSLSKSQKQKLKNFTQKKKIIQNFYRKNKSLFKLTEKIIQSFALTPKNKAQAVVFQNDLDELYNTLLAFEQEPEALKKFTRYLKKI